VSILIAFYGDYPFNPMVKFNPHRLDIMETDKVDYWEEIAEQAVRYFEYKEDFMDWVCRHFGAEDNRIVADGAWDLVLFFKESGLDEGLD